MNKSSQIQIVASNPQLKLFYEHVLRPLQEDEGYFISLSCRSKKMTDKERAKHKMTHKEMFARDIVFKPGFEQFMAKLYRMHCDKRAFPGLFLEPKALVCYICINPVSTGKALAAFKQRLADWEYKKIYKTAPENFHLFKNLYNCYHVARAARHYIDIDIDWQESSQKHPAYDVAKIENHLASVGFRNGRDYFIIRTGSGGLHTLVKISSLQRENIDVHMQIAEMLGQIFIKEAKEVKINADGMVPIPGTYQYGNVVKLINFGSSASGDKI